MIETRFSFKFTFFIFNFENFSFGHSVAICSLCVAYASLLTSNLRPSSNKAPPALYFFSGPTPVGRPFGSRITNKKNRPYGRLFYWCRQRDSNSRPTDYKSVALPTELCRHNYCQILYTTDFILSITNFIFFYTKKEPSDRTSRYIHIEPLSLRWAPYNQTTIWTETVP